MKNLFFPGTFYDANNNPTSIFARVQDRMQDFVRAVMAIAIIIFGYRLLMSGKELPKPAEWKWLALKLALVFYFALGEGVSFLLPKIIDAQRELMVIVLEAGLGRSEPLQDDEVAEKQAVYDSASDAVNEAYEEYRAKEREIADNLDRLNAYRNTIDEVVQNNMTAQQDVTNYRAMLGDDQDFCDAKQAEAAAAEAEYLAAAQALEDAERTYAQIQDGGGASSSNGSARTGRFGNITGAINQAISALDNSVRTVFDNDTMPVEAQLEKAQQAYEAALYQHILHGGEAPQEGYPVRYTDANGDGVVDIQGPIDPSTETRNGTVWVDHNQNGHVDAGEWLPYREDTQGEYVTQSDGSQYYVDGKISPGVALNAGESVCSCSGGALQCAAGDVIAPDSCNNVVYDNGAYYYRCVTEALPCSMARQLPTMQSNCQLGQPPPNFTLGSNVQSISDAMQCTQAMQSLYNNQVSCYQEMIDAIDVIDSEPFADAVSVAKETQRAAKDALDTAEDDLAAYVAEKGGRICDFSHHRYKAGYEDTRLWDMMDCRMASYLGIGLHDRDVSVPQLLYIGGVALISDAWGVPLFLTVITFTVFMLLLIMRVVHIYIMAFIALVLLFFIFPLIVLAILFNFTKNFFDNWLRETIGYVLQPIILFAFMSFILSILDIYYYGESTYFDRHGKIITTDRMGAPIQHCSDRAAGDDTVCVDTASPVYILQTADTGSAKVSILKNHWKMVEWNESGDAPRLMLGLLTLVAISFVISSFLSIIEVLTARIVGAIGGGAAQLSNVPVAKPHRIAANTSRAMIQAVETAGKAGKGVYSVGSSVQNMPQTIRRAVASVQNFGDSVVRGGTNFMNSMRRTAQWASAKKQQDQRSGVTSSSFSEGLDRVENNLKDVAQEGGVTGAVAGTSYVVFKSLRFVGNGAARLAKLATSAGRQAMRDAKEAEEKLRDGAAEERKKRDFTKRRR